MLFRSPSYQYRDTSKISGLYSVINNFSNSLTEKLDRLGKFYEKNNDNIIEQQILFEKLDNLDITGIAAANAEIIEKFGEHAKSLGQLNEALSNVGIFVEESRKLSNGVNLLFERYKYFEKNIGEIAEKIMSIAGKINEKIDVSSELFEFLKQQFEEFGKRETAFKNIMGKIEETTIYASGNLSKSVKRKIDDLIKEVDVVDTSFNISMDNLTSRTEKQVDIFDEHLKNLDGQMTDQLGKVEQSLREQFDKLKNNTENQAEFIATAHESVEKKLNDQLELLRTSIAENINNISTLGEEQIAEMNKTVENNHALLSRLDRKSTRLNSSHTDISRMPSSA